MLRLKILQESYGSSKHVHKEITGSQLKPPSIKPCDSSLLHHDFIARFQEWSVAGSLEEDSEWCENFLELYLSTITGNRSLAMQTNQYSDWTSCISSYEIVVGACTTTSSETSSGKYSRLFYQKHPLIQIDAFNQTRFLTYQQIHDQVLTNNMWSVLIEMFQSLSVAAFLRSQGFSVGDRACTVLANCIEWVPLLGRRIEKFSWICAFANER